MMFSNYKITIYDESPLHWDARNPSIFILEMSVHCEVASIQRIAKSLKQELCTSSDIKLKVYEISSVCKEVIICPK